MAHTPRKANEKRRHPVLYPNGTRIGMYVGGELVTGKVGSADEGGWIYPIWDKRPANQNLPGWCRCTNVFKLEGDHAA